MLKPWRRRLSRPVLSRVGSLDWFVMMAAIVGLGLAMVGAVRAGVAPTTVAAEVRTNLN